VFFHPRTYSQAPAAEGKKAVPCGGGALAQATGVKTAPAVTPVNNAASSPNDAEAHIAPSKEHMKKENYGKAKADYTQAVKLAPDFAWAYKNRGDSEAGCMTVYNKDEK
jgi:tetratricopeptide (TPR) repeat protein